MVRQSDYDWPAVQACMSVLVEVMTVLGEFRENIVIVGGSVPPLLVPSAKEKHPGTLDIDLAIDDKSVSDDSYRTIAETLKASGYYQKAGEQPAAFYRDVDDEEGRKTTVQVDLLASEYGGTGRHRRHQRIQDAHARKARGCDLVFHNPVRVQVAGRLPNGAVHEVTVKIPSIGAFMVTKGMALWSRMREKDAFDVYYCCRYYPCGLGALVRDIRPLTDNKLAREGLAKIMARFTDVSAIGPVGVAHFLELSDQEERLRVQRQAFELINALMTELGIEPFSED